MKSKENFQELLDEKFKQFKSLIPINSTWKLIDKSQKLSIHLNSIRNGVDVIRSEGQLDGISLDYLENLIWNNPKDWLKVDDSIQEYKVLETFDDDKRKITYSLLKTTTFVSHRDLIILMERKRENNNLFIYGFSIEKNDFKTNKGTIRAKCHVWGWKFTEIDKSKTNCININYTDLGGSLPHFVVKKVLIKEHGYLIPRIDKVFKGINPKAKL